MSDWLVAFCIYVGSFGLLCLHAFEERKMNWHLALLWSVYLPITLLAIAAGMLMCAISWLFTESD